MVAQRKVWPWMDRKATKPRQALRARYDNAETTTINERYWAYAVARGPEPTRWERESLANRCRYECRNNSWAQGLMTTIANDTIGTGPRLQMLTGDDKLNDEIEDDFSSWAQEIGLPAKLRTMRMARMQSGEAFGLMGTNKGIDSDVKLDLIFIEPEQVSDPFAPTTESIIDGISYDEFGNAIAYTVLRQHPSDMYLVSLPTESDRWPARDVLHYFRPLRPGQRRGVPDLTPAIDQFAELRRYSKAVIAAAEAIADQSLVITTNSEDNIPNEDGSIGANALSAMDQIEMGRWLGHVLPKGYEMGQPKAEQPIGTYVEFVNSKLSEIARCLDVPFYVAGLDSAGANMSATYVIGQKYERTITVDRSEIERMLNRLLDKWLTEWIFVRRLRGGIMPERFARLWQWDAIGNHADPAKVANARQTELANGTTNIPREYARDGLDWQKEMENDAKSMGISVSELQKLMLAKRFGSIQAAAPSEPENVNEDE